MIVTDNKSSMSSNFKSEDKLLVLECYLHTTQVSLAYSSEFEYASKTWAWQTGFQTRSMTKRQDIATMEHF